MPGAHVVMNTGENTLWLVLLSLILCCNLISIIFHFIDRHIAKYELYIRGKCLVAQNKFFWPFN